MGLTQSQEAFFGHGEHVDADHVDIYHYLYRVEQPLWREVPPWATLSSALASAATAGPPASPSKGQQPQDIISKIQAALLADPTKRVVRNCVAYVEYGQNR